MSAEEETKVACEEGATEEVKETVVEEVAEINQNHDVKFSQI